MVQRSVRQENSQVTIEGRNLVGDRAPRFSPEKNNRPLDCEQCPALLYAHFAEFFCNFKARHHDREWLFDASFALTEKGHSCRIRCVGGEMEPPQPFHGQNQSSLERRCAYSNRIAVGSHLAVLVPKLQLRSAVPTGIRLRVEAA